MIDIAPKALRFARLAAEQQPSFSNDPEIAVIKQREAYFRQKPAGDRVRRYVEISERTAEFCLRAIAALLAQPDRFHSDEWDGNDFAFLQVATQPLTDQLARSTARSI